MKKQSKEMEALLDAVDKFIKKHNGKVQMVCSIMAFKGKDCKVVEDRIMGYGVKECMITSLIDLLQMADDEKEDFINW